MTSYSKIVANLSSKVAILAKMHLYVQGRIVV